MQSVIANKIIQNTEDLYLAYQNTRSQASFLTLSVTVVTVLDHHPKFQF